MLDSSLSEKTVFGGAGILPRASAALHVQRLTAAGGMVMTGLRILLPLTVVSILAGCLSAGTDSSVEYTAPDPGPRQSATVSLGAPFVVDIGAMGLPTYNDGSREVHFFPDGHIGVSWDATNNTAQIFWAEYVSFVTSGIDVESSMGAQQVLGEEPATGAFGEGVSDTGNRSRPEDFDNSGSWLMSAFRVNPGTFELNPHSRHLIGFYHGEDHWFTDASGSREGESYYHTPTAWMAIGRTRSSDSGLTWSRDGMIVGMPDCKPPYPSSHTHPSKGPFGGIGNHSAVLDQRTEPDNPAWVLFFPLIDETGIGVGHGITAVRSNDPEGSYGSWYSYYAGGFDILQHENIGKHSALPGLDGGYSGLNPFALSNPSVHWNLVLDRWVLVAATWDRKRIMISFSRDASIVSGWTRPVVLYEPPAGRTVRYATIIGLDANSYLSSTEIGGDAEMFWAEFDESSKREAMGASVLFRN